MSGRLAMIALSGAHESGRLLVDCCCCGVHAAAARALEPSINYALHCMGCHTPDGSEVGGSRARDTQHAAAFLADARRAGNILVQVPGAAQSTLSNAELADLLNWMIENLSSRTEPARSLVTRRGKSLTIAGTRSSGCARYASGCWRRRSAPASVDGTGGGAAMLTTKTGNRGIS